MNRSKRRRSTKVFISFNRTKRRRLAFLLRRPRRLLRRDSGELHGRQWRPGRNTHPISLLITWIDGKRRSKSIESGFSS